MPLRSASPRSVSSSAWWRRNSSTSIKARVSAVPSSKARSLAALKRASQTEARSAPVVGQRERSGAARAALGVLLRGLAGLFLALLAFVFFRAAWRREGLAAPAAGAPVEGTLAVGLGADAANFFLLGLGVATNRQTL